MFLRQSYNCAVNLRRESICLLQPHKLRERHATLKVSVREEKGFYGTQACPDVAQELIRLVIEQQKVKVVIKYFGGVLTAFLIMSDSPKLFPFSSTLTGS